MRLGPRYIVWCQGANMLERYVRFGLYCPLSSHVTSQITSIHVLCSFSHVTSFVYISSVCHRRAPRATMLVQIPCSQFPCSLLHLSKLIQNRYPWSQKSISYSHCPDPTSPVHIRTLQVCIFPACAPAIVIVTNQIPVQVQEQCRQIKLSYDTKFPQTNASLQVKRLETVEYILSQSTSADTVYFNPWPT